MAGLVKDIGVVGADWNLMRAFCVTDPICCTSYLYGDACGDHPLVVPSQVFLTVAGIPNACLFGNAPSGVLGVSDQLADNTLQNRTYQFVRNPPGFLVTPNSAPAPNPYIDQFGVITWGYTMPGTPPLLLDDPNDGIVTSWPAQHVGNRTNISQHCTQPFDYWISGFATLQCSSPNVSVWAFDFVTTVIATAPGTPSPPGFGACVPPNVLGPPAYPAPVNNLDALQYSPIIFPFSNASKPVLFAPNQVGIDVETEATFQPGCYNGPPGPGATLHYHLSD